MTERTYDRLVRFDERSRSYAATALMEPAQAPRSYEWGLGLRLDQGQQGACTAFAVAHEAAAEPDPRLGISDATAFDLYDRARQLDDMPGEDYSGTSVLAALKAAQEIGWYSEYRWAFGIDDLVLALGWLGPAVLGIDWFEGMEETDGYAHIHPEGKRVGGHAIVATGVDLDTFGGRVKLVNSWGAGWGWHGTCWISIVDLDRLLNAQGEAAIPVVRSAPAAA